MIARMLSSGLCRRGARSFMEDNCRSMLCGRERVNVCSRYSILPSWSASFAVISSASIMLCHRCADPWRTGGGSRGCRSEEVQLNFEFHSIYCRFTVGAIRLKRIGGSFRPHSCNSHEADCLGIFFK